MVRHGNAVHADVHRVVSVLDRLDAFEHNGGVPVSRKTAMSSHVRNLPELTSSSHPMLSANVSRACSSPAARRARNASMSSGNAGRSSGRGARPPFGCRPMKTGSDVPTCTPTPTAKGRYAVSRSCWRQPRRKVSSVTTSVVKPAALARRRSESVTSFVRGLLAPHEEG